MSTFDRDRLRLVNLLTEAAELEHSLACQYLFAAFTLETRPDHGPTWEELESIRRWKAQTLLVARQEMEHLGLVANLLTAIGEAPYFDRPDFPTRRGYYPIRSKCCLEPFSLHALERYILFEMDQREAAPSSIARMYREIREIFERLGRSDPARLFVGPQEAQTGQSDLIPVPLRGIVLPPNTPFYNVLVEPVVGLTSALKVIDQIMTEGEGSPHDHPNSHFGIFRRMHGELSTALAANPSFVPARPSIENPRTSYRDEDPRPSTITVESTNRLSELFDLGYATMMLMIIRFFAHTDETAAELSALQMTAFFPLMTTFVRPVGEMLTMLPARGDQPGKTAGPSFIYPRRLEMLPHKKAAFRIMHSQLLAMQQLADELSKDKAFPEKIRERLTLVYENTGRMAINFRAATNLPEGG